MNRKDVLVTYLKNQAPNYGKETVIRWLKEHHFEPAEEIYNAWRYEYVRGLENLDLEVKKQERKQKAKRRIRFSEAEKQMIMDEYNKGLTIRQVSNKLGWNYNSVCGVIKKLRENR